MHVLTCLCFNTVNNKELGCGQQSVVWLKRGQSCLHQLHVLSAVFSWRPFSSFSLWIILLPSDSCWCLAMIVCLAVSSAISWFESSTTVFLGFFPLRWIDCGFAFTCLAVKQLTNLAIKRSNELSGLAVHELSGSSGSRAQQLSGPQAQ